MCMQTCHKQPRGDGWTKEVKDVLPVSLLCCKLWA